MAKKKLTYDVASKIVTETFLSEVNSLSSPEDIKSKVIDAQRAIRQISDTEADDAQLTAAREIVKDLGKGYREATKNEQAKIVVCLQRLEALGG